MSEKEKDTTECNIDNILHDNTSEYSHFPKTWLLYVKYDSGIGWAIVNAPTVSLAQGVFLRQTKFVNPKIIQLKELKFFGEEWQICYEDGVSLENYN